MKLQNLIPSIISVNDQGELVELSPEVVESGYPGIKYILYPGSKKTCGVIRNDELIVLAQLLQDGRVVGTSLGGAP